MRDCKASMIHSVFMTERPEDKTDEKTEEKTGRKQDTAGESPEKDLRQ